MNRDRRNVLEGVERIASKWIDFGDWDADHDHLLDRAFVDCSSFRLVRERHYHFILGRKGSGKTAFVRHQHLARASYTTRLISADEAFFRELTKQLLSIEQDPEDCQRVWIEAWKDAIQAEVFHMLVKAYENGITNGADAKDYKVVQAYLRDNAQEPGRLSSFLLGTIVWALSRMSNVPLGDAAEIRSLLSSSARRKASIDEATAAAVRMIECYPYDFLLAFDGMDRFFDLSEYGVDAHFHGMRQIFVIALLYAATDLVKSKLFAKVDLKVMLPLDKFISLRFRDRIKVDQHSIELDWNRSELLEFCSKRIVTSARSLIRDHGSSDYQIWNRVFPEDVAGEDSFDYVMRHTMMRPRDFQVHWKKIYEAAVGEEITEEALVQGVRNGCNELAKYYLDEWASEFPYLRTMLDQFRGADCVIRIGASQRSFLQKICSRVNSYLEQYLADFPVMLPFPTTQKVRDDGKVEITDQFILRFLYTLGFLGKIDGESYDGVPKGKIVSKFFCYHPHPDWSDGDWILVHPIFYSRYNIQEYEELVSGPGLTETGSRVPKLEW